ncbi:MAG TPA: ABC transporter permease [Pseudonocardiaceae bacterium]|nr:ABC transporter permease [Pseudonocardiaceae bacterium]
MIQYVIRRLLISIPILVIGTFVAYILVASSGDPIAGLAARPGVTAAVIANARHNLGLDQNILERYWHWLTHFVQGDWGTSIALTQGGEQVRPAIMSALWVTVRLVVGAEIIALILGMAVGALAALRQYSIFDYLATTAAFLLFSMPIFCVAIVLENYGIQFNNALQSMGGQRWLTVAAGPPGGFSGDFFNRIFQYTGSFTLPTISIMVISFAAYSRFQRASMLETLGTDYVRTARAKGLSGGRVVFRHAFRNALIPVTTLFSLNFGSAFTGAIATETVFAWHGMGSVLVASVQQYDPDMLMGFLVVTAALIIIFNLIADIMYGFLDPRIRLG